MGIRVGTAGISKGGSHRLNLFADGEIPIGVIFQDEGSGRIRLDDATRHVSGRRGEG